MQCNNNLRELWSTVLIWGVFQNPNFCTSKNLSFLPGYNKIFVVVFMVQDTICLMLSKGHFSWERPQHISSLSFQSWRVVPGCPQRPPEARFVCSEWPDGLAWAGNHPTPCPARPDQRGTLESELVKGEMLLSGWLCQTWLNWVRVCVHTSVKQQPPEKKH